MSRKRTNPHKPFMVFNAVLFIAVLATCAIFLYLAYTFKRDAEKKEKAYDGGYHIEIGHDFAKSDISIYLNDSLVLNRVMPDSTIQFDIQRFAEEHVLIVVDNATDKGTPFNLSKDGGKVIIKKKDGEAIIEETPSRF